MDILKGVCPTGKHPGGPIKICSARHQPRLRKEEATPTTLTFLCRFPVTMIEGEFILAVRQPGVGWNGYPVRGIYTMRRRPLLSRHGLLPLPGIL